MSELRLLSTRLSLARWCRPYRPGTRAEHSRPPSPASAISSRPLPSPTARAWSLGVQGVAGTPPCSDARMGGQRSLSPGDLQGVTCEIFRAVATPVDEEYERKRPLLCSHTRPPLLVALYDDEADISPWVHLPSERPRLRPSVYCRDGSHTPWLGRLSGGGGQGRSRLCTQPRILASSQTSNRSPEWLRWPDHCLHAGPASSFSCVDVDVAVVTTGAVGGACRDAGNIIGNADHHLIDAQIGAAVLGDRRNVTLVVPGLPRLAVT